MKESGPHVCGLQQRGVDKRANIHLMSNGSVLVLWTITSGCLKAQSPSVMWCINKVKSNIGKRDKKPKQSTTKLCREC